MPLLLFGSLRKLWLCWCSVTFYIRFDHGDWNIGFQPSLPFTSPWFLFAFWISVKQNGSIVRENHFPQGKEATSPWFLFAFWTSVKQNGSIVRESHFPQGKEAAPNARRGLLVVEKWRFSLCTSIIQMCTKGSIVCSPLYMIICKWFTCVIMVMHYHVCRQSFMHVICK